MPAVTNKRYKKRKGAVWGTKLGEIETPYEWGEYLTSDEAVLVIALEQQYRSAQKGLKKLRLRAKRRRQRGKRRVG